MDFEELIETLSKGSATAVTTLESNVAELNALKEYLYVQTPVESALRAEIDRNLKTPRVIFVCGSSGDGKSGLFRRIHANKVRFALHGMQRERANRKHDACRALGGAS
jgi:DNA phosphorothioation-dependent restriction protein DptF